jgi:hypothetical protein
MLKEVRSWKFKMIPAQSCENPWIDKILEMITNRDYNVISKHENVKTSEKREKPVWHCENEIVITKTIHQLVVWRTHLA